MLLRDAFDLLWTEGQDFQRMMSVGLHSRISGHPARAAAVARFLEQERRQVAAEIEILGDYGPFRKDQTSP